VGWIVLFVLSGFLSASEFKPQDATNSNEQYEDSKQRDSENMMML
jgi:hypothetical protein